MCLGASGHITGLGSPSAPLMKWEGKLTTKRKLSSLPKRSLKSETVTSVKNLDAVGRKREATKSTAPISTLSLMAERLRPQKISSHFVHDVILFHPILGISLLWRTLNGLTKSTLGWLMSWTKWLNPHAQSKNGNGKKSIKN